MDTTRDSRRPSEGLSRPKRLRGLALAVALGCASVGCAAAESVESTPPEPPCELATLDRELVRDAFAAWQDVEDRLLLDPRPELPWIVLVGERCTWIFSAPSTSGAERQILPEVVWRGGEVEASVRAHGGEIELPSGDTVGTAPLASTSIAAGGDRPFFVLSMPEVWARHPAFADAPDSALRDFWIGVVVHELVHTRQIVPVAARLEVLTAGLELEGVVDDDLIERRFGPVPEFAESVRRELELLQAAATAPELAESRRVALEYLEAADRRRAAFFHGADEPFAEIEILFLSLEGAACWLAWLKQEEEELSVRARHELLAEYDPLGTALAQGYGLLLYALIDRHVPDWRESSFGRLPASPLDLLRDALIP